jgi:transcription elongation factor Elf1
MKMYPPYGKLWHCPKCEKKNPPPAQGTVPTCKHCGWKWEVLIPPKRKK